MTLMTADQDILKTHLDLPVLSDATGYAVPRGAVVLTTAGFEERAVVAAKQLAGLEHSTVVVVRYSHDEPSNRLAEILAILRRRQVTNIQQVAYDRLQPDDYPPLLTGALEDAKPTLICVDVSAMSKLALMLTLDVCRELNLDTVLFYAEAQEYGPSLEEYTAARKGSQLARPSSRFFAGVQEVVRVRRLSSVAMQGQPSAAIVFMSFNELLTQALIDSVCPSRLFLINGRPPVLRWREEATAWIHDELRREWPESDNPVSGGFPVRTTSTLDYRDTVRCLLELYWRLTSSYRILLAPTGSKMQAVAAALVRFVHPDIHIEYPVPQGDLDLHGTGVGRTWLIPLGHLGSECARWTALEREERLTIAL
jgi:hypothetical protein